MKPFSEACERNRDPILAVLKRVFADRRRVLEIGSGTGQHAAYFAPEHPPLDALIIGSLDEQTREEQA